MTKQKKGFWLFLFSLIPGAGEMYMGFQKQGISIMTIFWSVIALSAGTGMSWIIMFLPILWFYSFFNVHNLKSLSEEEFYSVEDKYVLHLDQLFGDMDTFIRKYRMLVSVILIVFGISILCNNFADILYWFFPGRLGNLIQSISYQLPQIILAVAIILAGFYILSDKKQRIMKEEPKEEAHYWEPYRPYQQEVSPAEEKAPTITEPLSPISENIQTETSIEDPILDPPADDTPSSQETL